jgi:outer membrane protein assembly factor BamD
MKLQNLLLLIATFIFLTGCKNRKSDDENIFPARLLYNNGKELLRAGKYKKAAEEFEKIYFQHPGSDITPQAELMEAYALYLDGKYEEASDILENFIKIHPLNIDISYAYYLRGLAEYMQISRAELDQTATEKAKAAFGELMTRFPGTKYAIDASLKLDLVYDHLAGSEMDIGHYYLVINNPISAITRYQNIIQNYGTTSHVVEALYRMTEAYMLLGLREEAEKYASVLGHNYNNSKWYKKSYHLITGHKARTSEVTYRYGAGIKSQ